ncbi:MAG: CaiB/BaiF CoA transferase family protein [Woeseia sp.]
MDLPLNDIRVVAVEQAVAAPYCTSRLADAGARVIKVERPEGDFAREYDDLAKGLSSYFVWLNRGKESVVLDLRDDECRKRLEQLLREADVFVQNLKPGALDRLGFSIARLRREYPPLICCSISGYGDEGPLSDRKAYDLLVQAESGLSSVTGNAQGCARVGISIADLATGAVAHSAILEALLGRTRSGAGTDIRVSMFDVMADWLTVPLLQAEAGRPPVRAGLAHPSIAPYGAFDTRDADQLLISIQSDREWAALCEQVLERPELAEDERFRTNIDRVGHRAATDDAVSQVFACLTSDELQERLASAGIAYARVNDMSDLSGHPHLRRVQVGTAAGTVSLPAPAPVFDGVPRRLGAVPDLATDADHD